MNKNLVNIRRNAHANDQLKVSPADEELTCEDCSSDLNVAQIDAIFPIFS
jgi:hypothetical protein